MGVISAGAANRAAGSIGGVGKDKNKGKGSAGGDAGGAGTAALMAGLNAAQSQTYAKVPGSAMAADKAWQAGGNRVINGRAEKGNGGTTATDTYSPGAVEVHPWADPTTIVEKTLLPAAPVVGTLLGAGGLLKSALDPDDPTGLLGGDPGPQKGWQPDRYKGRAQMTGVGAAEGDSSGEREIAGASLAALAGGPAALTDEQILGGNLGDVPYTDVELLDRRKPKTFQQMASEMMT